jgi:hypothetical protein
MPLTPGMLRAEVVEAPAEINRWLLLADTPGAAVVDVRKAADLAGFIAGTYASICGGSKPTLTGDPAAEGEAQGVWADVTLEVGNVVVYVVESADSAIAWLGAKLITSRK